MVKSRSCRTLSKVWKGAQSGSKVLLLTPYLDSQAKNTEVDKKNWELQEAFREKAKAHADIRKKYDMLKGDKMKDQVIDAASDDAERVLYSITGNRFVNRIDARTSHFQTQGRQRPLSASSESFDAMRRAVPAQLWNAQVHPIRGYTSRERNKPTL
jgi:hypothetical protein